MLSHMADHDGRGSPGTCHSHGSGRSLELFTSAGNESFTHAHTLLAVSALHTGRVRMCAREQLLLEDVFSFSPDFSVYVCVVEDLKKTFLISEHVGCS